MGRDNIYTIDGKGFLGDFRLKPCYKKIDSRKSLMEANMNIITPEELKLSGTTKKLSGDTANEAHKVVGKEAEMKDKQRIELFIEKHKKLLLKLAK